MRPLCSKTFVAGSFRTLLATGKGVWNSTWCASNGTNLHIERVYRIYQYMVRYIDPKLPLAAVEVESLKTLLRSDVPSRYGRLNDGKKSLIRFGGSILSPALWTQFSYKTIETHGLPMKPVELKAYGADVRKINEHPRMSQQAKEKQLNALPAKHFGSVNKETKILKNTVTWGVVAWSAASYLPEPELPKPKAHRRTV